MANSVYIWSDKNLSSIDKIIESRNIDSVFYSAYNTETLNSNIFKNLNLFVMASTNEFSLDPFLAIEYILSISKNADNDALKGFHFDVEPHALPQWNSERENVIHSYCEMIENSYSLCEKLGFEFGVSISDWFSIIPGLSEFVINNTDHISIMSYRSAEQVVEFVRPQMNYSNKKIYVAVDNISLSEKVNFELNKNYTFEGVAFHHLDKML